MHPSGATATSAGVPVSVSVLAAGVSASPLICVTVCAPLSTTNAVSPSGVRAIAVGSLPGPVGIGGPTSKPASAVGKTWLPAVSVEYSMLPSGLIASP